jgi:hypothetical protein
MGGAGEGDTWVERGKGIFKEREEDKRREV